MYLQQLAVLEKRNTIDSVLKYLQNPKMYQNLSQSHESKMKNDKEIAPIPCAAIAGGDVKVKY